MTLTPRQEQVAALVAQGLTDKQIAGVLRIAKRSVCQHVTDIATVLHLDTDKNTRVLLATWWYATHPVPHVA